MALDTDGFEVIESLLASKEAEELLVSLGKLHLLPLRGGIRRIEQMLPEVAALARSPDLLQIAQKHLSGPPRLVRAIYFDKSPKNNWFVTWHQDRTVAVSKRFEADGWGPWSTKAGAWHVQPPIEVLENMVTLRIHLDAATTANGCLKVAPGTHRLGLIPTDKVLDHVDGDQVVFCEVPVGGVVVMRPHVLHASEKATGTMPRRILHFEYSSYELPKGIAWAA